MAIVEVQFSEQAFSDLLKRELNNRRLPAATIQIGQPAVDNKLLDSITAIGCELVSDTTGELTARIDLLIRYYASDGVAQAAGSLKQPPTLEAQQRLAITIKMAIAQTPTGPRPALAYSSPLGLIKGGQFDLGDLGDFGTQVAAIALGDGVVAIRLGTNAADALDAPVVNGLVADTDWTLMVPGELIAAPFVAGLASAVADLTASDPAYAAGDAAAGSYVTTQILGFPAPPLVVASAEIIAVDACPLFNIDVSVDLSAIATFAANGPHLVTTLTLIWNADSTWCEIAGFFVATPISSIIIAAIAANEADDAVLGKATGLPGFKEISRNDDSITYRQDRFFSVPSQLMISSSQFTDSGLVIAGGVRAAQQGSGLQGWRAPARSDLDVSCSPRRVSVKFTPPVVGLYDYNPPGGPPTLFVQGTRFVPADAWVVGFGTSNSWQELLLAFKEPPGGHLPAGTATSVFLMTDCGLRWVDLGVIPADHPPPTTADMAFMISHCMAKSAGWKERVFSVKWLPRYPDDRRSIPSVRQWMLGIQEMPRHTRLEFVAVADGRHERILGVIEGQSHVAVYLTTDANETLEVRSNHDENPMPAVAAQRWISPLASLPLHGEPAAIAVVGDLLGVRAADGTTRIVDLRSDGTLHTRPLEGGRPPQGADRLREAFTRDERRGRRAWNSMAQIDAHTVAVVHKGSLLVGVAGELQTLQTDGPDEIESAADSFEALE